MKNILLLVAISVIMSYSHQYDMFNMNGRYLGSFNGSLNKYSVAEFAKKYHSTILVKKTYTYKSQQTTGVSLFHLNQAHKKFDLSKDSLKKDLWLEIEKNETVKICMDKRVLAWETSLNSKILNDSCLVFQAPMLVGVDTIKMHVPHSDSSYKIKLAVSMKYLNFKNEDVLLGYNSLLKRLVVTTTEGSFIPEEDDPQRHVSVTGTYLVDKYPVTNCEILHQMWDSIPLNQPFPKKYEDLQEYEKQWILRKKNKSRNANCDIHDTAAIRVFLFTAMKYANIRSIQEGLKPYYNFSTIENETIGIASKGKYIISSLDFSGVQDYLILVTVNETSNGYRLPYYDEWMMLARGGDKKNKAPWGNDSATYEEISKYAKFDTEKSWLFDSEPVGLLQPNGYGLYDMFGVGEQVLFEEINPFEGLGNRPSCIKGGLPNEDGKKINYGSFTRDNNGGFRLIRKLK